MSIQMFHFAVLGQPVAHSLSPVIHQAFAKQVGLSVQYDKIAAPLDGFVRAAQDFIAQGGQGFNVTMPFKPEAATWVDVLKDRAAQAGAVNTIGINPDGTIWGDNTDGEGLILALQQDMNMSLVDKAVVILGAGGAARGILPAILTQKPKKIWIYNRSEDKVRQLIEAANAADLVLSLSTEYPAVNVDLIINTLPAGISYFPKQISLTSAGLAYDINYYDKTGGFTAWAKAQGASTCSNGLSMLAWQAALAFKLWTGVMPVVVPVLRELRQLERSGV